MAKQYQDRNDKIRANKNQRDNYNHDNEFNLTAPYNFVPLSKAVVRPKWANCISHDIPFIDAQCGSLKLTIEAKQPIFVHNSVSRRVINDNDRKQMGSQFSNLNNRYFLPGSSIKGAIRNVLEILTFGDMSKRLNNDIWSMRDLTLQGYKDLFTWDSRVHCGWLRKSGDNYVIDDCSLPHRISHEQIDKHFASDILANWARSFQKNPSQEKKHLKYSFAKGTAQKKYQLFKGKNLKGTFNISGNDIVGELVFTGQPSIKFDREGKGTIQVNEEDSIKYKEFIFGNSSNSIILTEEVIEAFEFAYHRLKLTSDHRIPVFFHKNNEGKVASFGLAYMYKIPFTYSVKEAILNHQENPDRGHDLAECIFGYAEKDNALRGRVTFGHAFLQNEKQPMNEKKEVLNSPKATYYPTYIRQEVKANGKIKENSYKTLFDKDAVPSGWKRYPVHSDAVKANPGPVDKDGSYNEKIQTKFRPIEIGALFNCTVNYHNLKKVELGALLSALTFHNTADCFHTLGMAKPLGYGKCKITVYGIDEELKNQCLCAFERYMEGELKQGWLKSEQLQELFAMGQDRNNSGRSELKYMSKVKDFADAKRKRLALDKYTKLDNIKPGTPNKICVDTGVYPVAISLEKESHTKTFERIKNELIAELKNKKIILMEQELMAKVKKERQQQEEVRKRNEDAHKTAERSAGINLNGVNKNKTIEGLLRTLKRWVESVGGDIYDREVNQIKNRFSQLYDGLKEKDKKHWSEKITAELPRLQSYLSTAQIQELKEHISQIP